MRARKTWSAFTYVNLRASDVVRTTIKSRHFRQPRDGMLRAGIRRRLGSRDVRGEGAVVKLVMTCYGIRMQSRNLSPAAGPRKYFGYSTYHAFLPLL